MSAPKFTPGPWAFEKWFYGGHGYRIYSARGAHSIAGTSGHPYDFANAQLIAAAPDLYAALETLVGWFADDDYDFQKLDDARAALAKARGEKP